jgi:N-acetyl-anhydromuramyl-L-alanine amidase AmpD
VNGYHKRKWNMESQLGYFVCYHYFIGTTGAVVQTRAGEERPGCTRNDYTNDHSIQVVVAGAFEHEKPTQAQLASLKKLVNGLQLRYKIPSNNIIGHKEASATTCPGKYMMDIIHHYRSKYAKPL